MENNLPMTHNNENTKCTQKRQGIKSCKGKGQSHILRRALSNNSWSFYGDSESQKGVDRYSRRHHNYQLRLLDPTKLLITIDREKNFTIKTNLSNFCPLSPSTRRQQEKLQSEDKANCTQEDTRDKNPRKVHQKREKSMLPQQNNSNP